MNTAVAMRSRPSAASAGSAAAEDFNRLLQACDAARRLAPSAIARIALAHHADEGDRARRIEAALPEVERLGAALAAMREGDQGKGVPRDSSRAVIQEMEAGERAAIDEAAARFKRLAEHARAGEIPAGDVMDSLLDHAMDKFLPAADSYAQIARRLREAASEGEESQARRSMKVIETAIAEIDHISRSVNLISLNASVEAARAGEAGKGFAVIAAEIQELSAKAQAAVKNVRARLSGAGENGKPAGARH
ncbi:methyl-accepting chemotaxis protein [Rhodovulum sp. DZ06]|uniref:methyl-accepting chemotaxis protein n=1 Tax=Rhodovulum sp. DZ06 TaxID=3425126 RepID=UPI003D32F980